MTRIRATRNSLVALAALAGAALLAACSGGGSGPTEPQTPSLALTAAAVEAGGQTMSGASYTFHQPSGAPGGSTRFEAHLQLRGMPAPGESARVIFDRPGPGMMPDHGVFLLYDDGTHGDPEAGDGVYCFEDSDGSYGFHHAHARHGEYRYDFYGLDGTGAESNHMAVTVSVTD